MLPSEGSRLDDPNQNTHPRMSAHHEDPSKTANRSCKEQQGKCLWHFFKFGKKLILPSDFKTISFEKFILWEKAVRKLDSSPVGIESPNKGTDRTAVMTKPAYLSVEIVTYKHTSGKISIPQVVSVPEQTDLSLTCSQI